VLGKPHSKVRRKAGAWIRRSCRPVQRVKHVAARKGPLDRAEPTVARGGNLCSQRVSQARGEHSRWLIESERASACDNRTKVSQRDIVHALRSGLSFVEPHGGVHTWQELFGNRDDPRWVYDGHASLPCGLVALIERPADRGNASVDQLLCDCSLVGLQ
jgi:hypothetical protein